jgi:hypothetical protein
VKYIEKIQEPQSFADWKSLANEDWQPTYDWSFFKKNALKALPLIG